MKIEWMECFITVAKTGSVNKTAELLFLTQPNVTKMLQSLERELGVELLLRKKSGIEMTEKGKMLYPYAKSIVETYRQYYVDAAMADSNSSGKELTGSLDFFITAYLLHSLYKDLVPSMGREFPLASVNYLECSLNELFRFVAEQENRVGMASFPVEMLPQIPKELDMIVLDRSPLVACINKVSGYLDNQVVRTEDLSQKQIYLGLYTQFRPREPESGQLATTNLDLIKELVLTNDDIYVVMPETVAHRLFDNRQVSFLHFAGQEEVVIGFIFHKTMSSENNYIMRIAELLQQLLRQTL